MCVCVYIQLYMWLYDWFSLKETEELKVPEITMSEASSEVEPLPESYFTQPVNLAKGNIQCSYNNSDNNNYNDNNDNNNDNNNNNFYNNNNDDNENNNNNNENDITFIIITTIMIMIIKKL